MGVERSHAQKLPKTQTTQKPKQKHNNYKTQRFGKFGICALFGFLGTVLYILKLHFNGLFCRFLPCFKLKEFKLGELEEIGDEVIREGFYRGV